jgi:Caspase domain
VTTLRARADGRPAEVQTVGAPTAAAGAEEREVLVRFNGEPAQLQLMAENRNGLSAPAVVALVWPGAPARPEPAALAAPAAGALAVATAPAAAVAAATVTVAAAATGGAKPPVLSGPGAPPPGKDGDFKIAPKLYILAIGVGRFASKDVPPLGLTAKDVKDFTEAMKKQQGKLYRGVETRVLIDQQATRDNIVDGLDWLQKQVTQHDIGMLFVSGHGTNDPQLGYMYVPYNFDPEATRRTGVNIKDFQKTLDSLAGKALFFIDTCHSGNVIGGARTRAVAPVDVSGVINELISAESGVVVFSASTGRQEALEDPKWGNGAFTKALIEGLQGQADYRKSGRVTHKMLDLYITERVKELTKGKQSPVTQAPGGVPDFPVAVVR